MTGRTGGGVPCRVCERHRRPPARRRAPAIAFLPSMRRATFGHRFSRGVDFLWKSGRPIGGDARWPILAETCWGRGLHGRPANLKVVTKLEGMGREGSEPTCG